MNDTLWIALAVLIPLVLLFAVFYYRNRKIHQDQKKRLENAYSRLMEQYELTAHEKDQLRDKIIAVDDHKRMLLFVTLSGEDERYDIVSLDDVNSCKVAKLGNRITEKLKSGKKQTEEHINQVQLEITTSGRQQLYLPFYDEIMDGIMEKQRLTTKAEKWRDIIAPL